LVGGTHGLAGIPGPFTWAGPLTLPLYSVVAVAAALAVFAVFQRLLNSPYGRLLKTIRENELASQVLGKVTAKVRGQVLAFGSAIAGMGGAIYAFYIGFVLADDFVPQRTFDAWLIVLLGGAANNKGVLLGALLVTLLDRSTLYLSGLVVLPFEVNHLRYMVFGTIMILLLFYRPSGIIREEPVKTPAVQVLESERDSKN